MIIMISVTIFISLVITILILSGGTTSGESSSGKKKNCNSREYESANSCSDLKSDGAKAKCSQRYVVNGYGEKINCRLDGDKCVDNGKCF